MGAIDSGISTAAPPAIAALPDPADGATFVTVRRILSRCGLILVVLAGLAGGVVGRLMWQPRVVAAAADAGESGGDGNEGTTTNRYSVGAVAAPRGVDPDVWQLLHGRPKAGGWAATAERLRAEGRDDLTDLVMLSWFEVDEVAALSWLADLPRDRWPGGGAVGQWIANHPAVSWRVALEKDSRTLAWMALAHPSVLAADPAALHEILTSGTGKWRGLVAEMARQFSIHHDSARFVELAAADFDTATRLLLATNPHQLSGPHSLLGVLLEADPKAAEKLLAHGSARERARWQAMLIPHLTRMDPKTAEDLLAAMPAGGAKDSAAVQLALARAGTDPQAVLALAETLGNAGAVASARFGALRGLAETDPAAALTAAEPIAASGATDPVIGDTRLIKMLSAVDWNRAFALAVRTNDPCTPSMLASKHPAEVANGLAFLREFGATDADAAARVVTILDMVNKDQIRALAAGAADNPLTAAARIWLAIQPVARGGAQDQPIIASGDGMRAPGAAMAQTLSTLDPSMVQPRIFSDTASSWARQEPERASEWVGGLPTGPARDAAIGGLVDALIGEPQSLFGWFTSSSHNVLSIQSSGDLIDYSAALAWAAATDDPGTREDLALRTARRWLDVDPAGAAEGLAGGRAAGSGEATTLERTRDGPMSRTLWRWARWPLLFGVPAVVGWATTSAVLQRRISAVWQDLPMRKVSMYPALMGRGVEARVSKLTKRGSLIDFTAWLAELAAETSPDRLRATLDAVRGLPDGWRMLAAETALARLADLDPRAALDFALLKLGDGSAGWNALANVLRARAADDPESLRPYLPAVARQLAFGQGGVAALARLSPDESLAFIQRWHLPLDHPGVQECVKGAVEQLGKTDPARALGLIGTLGVKLADNWQWGGRFRTIVEAWVTQAPEAALAWMRQHSGNPNDPFANITRGGYLEATAVARLARSDPQILVDWVKSRPSGPDPWGDRPVHVALASLRAENPEAAWQLLTTLVPPEKQASLAAAMVPGYGSSATQSRDKEAIAWVTAWPPEWRTSAPPLGGADAALRDDDFQQWLGLGVRLSPAGEARVAEQVERDPAAALAEFRSSTPAAQRSALPGVIAGLVNTDPAQAAALLHELPRGEAWAAATAQLATEWSRFDGAAADAWINTLPPGTAQRLRARLGPTREPAR